MTVRALIVGAAPMLVIAAGVAGQVVAESGVGLDVVCLGVLRGWTEGGSGDAPLLTFGARPLPAVPVSGSESIPARAAESALLRSRDAGAFTVGISGRGGGGPGAAGAMEGSAQAGYSYPGPRLVPPRAPAVRWSVELLPGRWVLSADVAAGRGRPFVRSLSVGVGSGRLAAQAGALPLRTGPGCAHGLVLGGGAGPLWGLDVRQRRGFRIPVLGGFTVGLQIGALPEAGPGNRRPLFHAMRVELRPSHDVVIGLNRAVIFGGSASEIPVTPRTVGLMLLGITDTRGKDSDFENQVASVDVRWRTRLSGRPVRIGAEYAADDAGFAFARVPGLRFDAEARVGPLPDSWSGLEVTWLAGPTATYPPWYRHGALAWGWTDRGVPLGDPLAGQGLSVAATWGIALPGTAIELGSGLVRRGDHNLLAPDLAGNGLLAELEARGWRGGWEWGVASSVTGAGSGSSAWQWSAFLARRF